MHNYQWGDKLICRFKEEQPIGDRNELCRRCMNNVQIQTMNVKNGVGDHRNIVTYVYEYDNPKIGLLFTNMML